MALATGTVNLSFYRADAVEVSARIDASVRLGGG